jgi:hypothetical protein
MIGAALIVATVRIEVDRLVTGEHAARRRALDLGAGEVATRDRLERQGLERRERERRLLVRDEPALLPSSVAPSVSRSR